MFKARHYSVYCFFSVFFMLTSFSARGYCIDDWACFSIDKQQNSVMVYLSNLKPYPITSTISVATKNALSGSLSQTSYEKTRVLAGISKVKVLDLTKDDPDKPLVVKLDQFNWAPGNMHAVHDESTIYLMPYQPGRKYRVVQGYGGDWSHSGASKYAVDFAMPISTPVHASRAGLVIDMQASHDKGGADRRYARYANFITILHDDGTTGEYYHLKKDGVIVTPGERVIAGQHIGFSGDTGFSSLPHLHFAVYRASSHGNYQSLPVKFETSLNSTTR